MGTFSAALVACWRKHPKKFTKTRILIFITWQLAFLSPATTNNFGDEPAGSASVRSNTYFAKLAHGRARFSEFVQHCLQWEPVDSELMSAYAAIVSDIDLRATFNESARFLRLAHHLGASAMGANKKQYILTTMKPKTNFDWSLWHSSRPRATRKGVPWPGLRTPAQAFEVFLARRGPHTDLPAGREALLALLLRDLRTWQMASIIQHNLPSHDMSFYVSPPPAITLEDGMCGPRQTIIISLLRTISSGFQGAPLKMAEIGVLHLGTAHPMLTLLPDLQWLGVDPYSELSTLPYHANNSICRGQNSSGDILYQQAAQLLSEFGDRAKLTRSTSVEAVVGLADRSLDFVFIDGDHRQKAVEQDLRLWEPKVAFGGILAGHDFDALGVAAAVARARSGRRLNLACSNIWFWQVLPDDSE